MMRAAWETLAGLARLASLVVRSGCRLRGAYWSWRWQTAFGAEPVPGRAERVRGVLGYARWMHRMRRMG